jgi:hypothetical protein
MLFPPVICYRGILTLYIALKADLWKETAEAGPASGIWTVDLDVVMRALTISIGILSQLLLLSGRKSNSLH